MAPKSIQEIYPAEGWVSVRIPRILKWEDPENPEFEQRQNASPAEAVSIAWALIKINKGESLDFFKHKPSTEEVRDKLYRIRHAYINLLNSGYKINRKKTLEMRLFQSVNELKLLFKPDYYNVISYDRDLVVNNLDNMTVVEDILRNSNLMKFVTLLLTNLKKEEDSYVEQLQILSMPTVSRDKILQVYEIIFNNPLVRSKDICESTGLTREELMAVYRYMQLNPLVQDMLIAKSPHSYYMDILGSVSHDDRDFWEAAFKGEKRFPVEVELHTSLWCPFDCEYCYSRNVRYLDLEYYKNLPHLPKEEKLFKISDLMKEFANGGTKRIYLSGGKEPIVDPFTFEIMKIAHDNGLEVIVNTDGVNLDGCGARFRNCRKVRERGEINIMNPDGTEETYRDDAVFEFYLKNSTKIRISMDFIRKEDKEAYNKSKNLSSDDPALDRIRESIRRLVQLRRGIKGRAAKIEIALLVIPENAMILEKTAEELKKLGVDSFVIRHINPTVSTQQVRPQEDMTPYLENIRKKYERDPEFNLEIRFEDFNKDRNLFGKDSKIRRPTRCWRAEYKTVFNPFGANIACCYTAHPGYEKMWGQNFILNPDETIYNASSFKDYWMRDDVIKRRTKEILASKCKACLMADRAINNAVEKVKDDFEFGIPLDAQPFIRSSILNPEGVFKE